MQPTTNNQSSFNPLSIIAPGNGSIKGPTGDPDDGSGTADDDSTKYKDRSWRKSSFYIQATIALGIVDLSHIYAQENSPSLESGISLILTNYLLRFMSTDQLEPTDVSHVSGTGFFDVDGANQFAIVSKPEISWDGLRRSQILVFQESSFPPIIPSIYIAFNDYLANKRNQQNQRRKKKRATH
ncbi:hypothetical protein G9A89_021129 [Geosiphon pyriformis]|nr:hypothetical protein G9A89_021129 [Geosiphon pyriformis]